MSRSKKVAIIGAGASGLLCSILCARAKLEVTLFEQNSKCGKKILVSGNGKCNISNTNANYKNYYTNGANSEFVKYALEQFDFKKFKNLVEVFGLLLQSKEDGKAYPLSLEAKNVVSILSNYAISLGVALELEHKIKNIKPLFESNKYDFVVVATGSNAASHLGGCCDGYDFAKEFNHNIIQTYPSLVQLHSNNKILKILAGVKIHASATLFIDNKISQNLCADVLFTTYGLSGLSILDISQKASLALHKNKKVDINIDLMPERSINYISEHIKQISSVSDLEIADVLCGLLPSKITKAILSLVDINPQTKASLLDSNKINLISKSIKKLSFSITDTHGYRHCEVSGGGVDTKEINPKTMQSLKKDGLYFCGEVLDVVADRGGYNFAFAWSSAYLASKDIIKKSNA